MSAACCVPIRRALTPASSRISTNMRACIGSAPAWMVTNFTPEAYYCYAVERPILQLGNPALWTPSSPIVDLADARRVADDLRDTLAAFRVRSGFGRGIAAPQIGVARRVLFIRVPDGFTDVLVNPVVAWS